MFHGAFWSMDGALQAEADAVDGPPAAHGRRADALSVVPDDDRDVFGLLKVAFAR